LERVSTIRELAVEVRTNHHLRREAFSMSLYVSIVLLSALAVFDDDHPPTQGAVFLLELGTTVGLVLAHAFASWVSTRLLEDPAEEVHPWDLLIVQLAGALLVASVSMVAVVVSPETVELQVARLSLAAVIALLVFIGSRPRSSTMRAAVHGLLALVAAVVVATLKFVLGH
jgi:hypothetical protein